MKTYRLVAIIKTTRKMVGSDEFLICTAQRAGLKRRHAKADVKSQTVTMITPTKTKGGKQS